MRQFDLDGHPISWFLFKNEKIETPIDITVNEKQDIFLLDGTLVRKFTIKGELRKEFDRQLTAQQDRSDSLVSGTWGSD